MHRQMVIGVLAVFLLIWGCSKDSKNPTGENPAETGAPSLPAAVQGTISSVPQNAPFEVQFGVVFIETPHATFSLFVDSATTELGPDVKWEFQNGQYRWVFQTDTSTITIQVTIGNNTQQWTVIFDGRWRNDGQVITVHNFHFIEATLASDGKSGQVTLYSPDLPDFLFQETWNTDANGAITHTLLMGGEFSGKMEVVNNPDGSGSYRSWSNNVLRYEASWNADGSGSWKSYDENGNLTGQGSWS